MNGCLKVSVSLLEVKWWALPDPFCKDKNFDYLGSDIFNHLNWWWSNYWNVSHILQNKSMSGSKYRSKWLGFCDQALKQPVNDLKRQQQKISQRKMAISNLFSSFICFTRVKSEKWRHILTCKKNGSESVPWSRRVTLFCTYYLPLLLTEILWHVRRPESLCRNQVA